VKGIGGRGIEEAGEIGGKGGRKVSPPQISCVDINCCQLSIRLLCPNFQSGEFAFLNFLYFRQLHLRLRPFRQKKLDYAFRQVILGAFKI
jgi:hypothetical protein